MKELWKWSHPGPSWILINRRKEQFVTRTFWGVIFDSVFYWGWFTVRMKLYLYIWNNIYLIYDFPIRISIWRRSCWGNTLRAARSRIRFPMVSMEIFIDIILPAAMWPQGWLNLQQKWVPGIFPGGKGGRWVGLKTLPLSRADCLENWEPQPPGTIRTCPGL